MKKLFYTSSFIILFFSAHLLAQENPPKISIKITDEKGEKIEKEYYSKEAMNNDPGLRELGIILDEEGSGIRLNISGENRLIMITQENDSNKIEILQRNQFNPGTGHIPPLPRRMSLPPPSCILTLGNSKKSNYGYWRCTIA